MNTLPSTFEAIFNPIRENLVDLFKTNKIVIVFLIISSILAFALYYSPSRDSKKVADSDFIVQKSAT